MGMLGYKIHTKISNKRYQRESVIALTNYRHRLIESMIYQGTADIYKVKIFRLKQSEQVHKDTAVWSGLIDKQGQKLDMFYTRSALHLDDRELEGFLIALTDRLNTGGYVCIEGCGLKILL